MADYGAGYARGRAQGLLQSAARTRASTASANRMMMAERARRDQLDIARKDLQIRIRDAQRRDFKEGQKMRIDMGLGQALQQGGYEAGIEFLKANDPRSAIAFHKEKLDLDQKIMSTDVMKTLSGVEKQKAMFEAYGAGGKIAAGIQRLQDPKDKAQAYQMMLPMLSKIAPGLPKAFNTKADTALKLMMAQGTPANILYKSEQTSIAAQNKIVKNHMALRELEQKGMGKSPAAEHLRAQIESDKTKALNSQLMASKTKLSQQKDKFNAMRNIQKDIRSASKGFIESMDNLASIAVIIKKLDQDPNDGYAQTQLRQRSARLTEKGTMTDKDIERQNSAAGYRHISKKLKQYFSGEAVVLDEKEQRQVKAIIKLQIDEIQRLQKAREEQFENMVTEGNFNNLVDWNAVVKPSNEFKSLVTGTPQGQQFSQEDLEYTAKKHNISVEEVKKRLQGMR